MAPSANRGRDPHLMVQKDLRIGFVGFGEVGQALASGWRDAGYEAEIFAFDVLDKTPEFKQSSVTGVDGLAGIRESANLIISAVTADQQLIVARQLGRLGEGTVYLDVNSVAPGKKQVAAEVIGPAYTDVAVLSPIHPHRHGSSMYAAGPSAPEVKTAIESLLPNCAFISTRVGDAALIKMIRSVFVKGIEAVTTECAIAAHTTGLAERIYPSLDVVLRHHTAKDLTEYSMERVATHGARRSAEMLDVCDTLVAIGAPDTMSRATAAFQRMVGSLDLRNQPKGLDALSERIMHALSQNQEKTVE